MLFFIGALLGDVVETVFMRLTKRVWMSESSVVWGPFSIVWGLALALGTAALYNYKESFGGILIPVWNIDRRCLRIFLQCFHWACIRSGVLGLQWNYFNLGGRINLLYCFFWGIAAVVWLRLLYPILSKLIEKNPHEAGKNHHLDTDCVMICNMR